MMADPFQHPAVLTDRKISGPEDSAVQNTSLIFSIFRSRNFPVDDLSAGQFREQKPVAHQNCPIIGLAPSYKR
jgi:hypothetical protein